MLIGSIAPDIAKLVGINRWYFAFFVLPFLFLTNYFVPPIYDLSVINGFFKIEEEEISAINRLIDEMENHPDLLSQIQQLNLLKKKSEEELLEAKRQMQVAKERRSIRRKATLSNEENDELNRESQYHKASYKRLQKSWKCSIILL